MKLDSKIYFLWDSFIAGDDKSFALIYQQYVEGLLSYGYKFTNDKELVHDAIQEVFMDLYFKREKLYVKIKNLKGYLFVALRNNMLKKLSKARKFDLKEQNETFDEYFDTEYNFQDNLIEEEISEEKITKLRSAINSLSSKQKEIIYLKFEQELEYPEIARALKINIESARKQLYRALKSLRETVDSQTFLTFFMLSLKKNLSKLSIF